MAKDKKDKKKDPKKPEEQKPQEPQEGQPPVGQDPPDDGGSKETVVVNKAELGKLLDRVGRLESAADKGRLDKYDAKFFKRGPNIFTLSEYDGKIITGWATKKDVSYKDSQTGRLIADQVYTILFHDDSAQEVSGYKTFSDIRYDKIIKVEEQSRNVSEVGTVVKVKVIEKDSEFYGKILDVDIKFVN